MVVNANTFLGVYPVVMILCAIFVNVSKDVKYFNVLTAAIYVNVLEIVR